MFETLLGAELPPALRFFIAFLVVLVLIGITAWAVRRFGAARFGGAATRGRQPRLAVVDAAAVDGRRRLVIIRRDNIEHLLMIGGPTDIVVEANIVRAMGVPRDTPSVRATLTDTLNRPVPLSEGTMWPLQPQPEAPSRPQRPAKTEEPLQWTAQAPVEQSPPPKRPETPASVADELSGRPVPHRDANAPGARTGAPPEVSRPAPPIPTRPAAESPPAGGSSDQNLAEMAHRLEAALRRPNEPRASEAPAKPPSIPASPAVPEPKSARAETKPVQSKSLYDSLEQEMASLLGRPPGKT
jgi:hypothetical protein